MDEVGYALSANKKVIVREKKLCVTITTLRSYQQKVSNSFEIDEERSILNFYQSIFFRKEKEFR